MNCFTFAFWKWVREGGYLMIRRSQLPKLFGITSKWHPAMWVPHFLHRTHDKVVTQYVPTDEQKAEHRRVGVLRAWLDLWHFKGKVIGDDHHEEH
jgi:hypothetical protein